MNDVRFGVRLPTMKVNADGGAPIRDVIGVAVQAERLGFDSVWAGDSLSRVRYEPLAVLAAAAQATARVSLGTAALMPVLRQPVMAAQEIATIDQLSGGRLVLGVGAGFPGRSENDLSAVGVDCRTRYSLLDDIVALWRVLWSDTSPSSFHGKVLHHDWLPDIPRPHRRGGPPIWYAGAMPAGLARVGRTYDGWLPYLPDVDSYGRGWADVQSAALAAGRSPALITPALFATVVITDDVGRGRRQLAEYCDAVYGASLEIVESIQVMFVGSADQIRTGVDRYVAAGARHVLVRMGTLDRADQLEQIAGALLPRSVAA